MSDAYVNICMYVGAMYAFVLLIQLGGKSCLEGCLLKID